MSDVVRGDNLGNMAMGSIVSMLRELIDVMVHEARKRNFCESHGDVLQRGRYRYTDITLRYLQPMVCALRG